MSLLKTKNIYNDRMKYTSRNNYYDRTKLIHLIKKNRCCRPKICLYCVVIIHFSYIEYNRFSQVTHEELLSFYYSIILPNLSNVIWKICVSI